MDGLSAAANNIAVIQISNLIFDLCRTYYINVKNARKDIKRLQNEPIALQDVLVCLVDLADDLSAASLQTLKLLDQEGGPVKQCKSELEALAAMIDFGEEKGR
jgi:ankyrin repeat domain-containing protein 50